MELLIDDLGKKYVHHWGVRHVSLRCGPGLVGLIGPNGAGKTTLMRMLATLQEPTEGAIWWNGEATRLHGEALRHTLGYLPQEFGIYREFTGRTFLRYLAAMKGLPNDLAKRRVEETLEQVNLTPMADRKLTTYSGGMKQRIGIAQALLNDLELLIVDEPTAGLDPAERAQFRTLLASLASSRLILLSTHIISDVEAIASRLVIMRAGQVLADTPPDALLASATGKVWDILTDQATALRLQANYPVSAMVSRPQGIALRLISATCPLEEATPAAPSLEDAYLLVMKRKEPLA
jgi:ABC-2 type transport system ATP-binding protein